MPLDVTKPELIRQTVNETLRQYDVDVLFHNAGLGGKKDFASVEESVQAVWAAVTDGEDRLHYPADAVAQKLYDEYQQMNIEDFKKYFYELLYQ